MEAGTKAIGVVGGLGMCRNNSPSTYLCSSRSCSVERRVHVVEDAV